MSLLGFIPEMGHELWDIATHEMGFVIAGLVGGGLLFFLKKIKKIIMMFVDTYKSRFRNRIPEMVDRDMEIYTQLFEIKAKTSADRVFLFQLHNGTYYINSTSQMKMSCTHEIVGEGIARESRSMQDLIVSQHTPFIRDLLQNPCICLDRNTIRDSCLGLMLSSQGVKTAVISLFKHENIIEGFLGIVYLDDVPIDRRATQIPIVEERREPNSDGSIANISEYYSSRIGYLLRKKL